MKITINKYTFNLLDIKGFNTEAMNGYEKEVFSLILKWRNNDSEFTFHTSGSTGIPKTITASRSHLEASAKRTLIYFDINSGTVLNCLSVTHIGGAMQVIRALVYKLDLIVVTPSKSPFSIIIIPWEEVEILSLVPYQLDYLLTEIPYNLNQCKTILLGGAPVSNTLKCKLVDVNLSNVYETYGMTETLSHIALKNTLKDNFFTILKGIKISTDTRGCLRITDTFLKLDNLNTNDLVEIKDGKSFKWLGRYDNVINTGGIKVITEEIEGKIKSLFPKNDFFIFSKDHATLGEEINLVIKGVPFEIEKSVFSSVLKKYEVPKNIYFLEKFIRTSTQKTLRKETIAQLSFN